MLKSYQEKIEMEKERDCLKALEREKIARGMFCTKEDEIALREMQKSQMEEKRLIEKEEKYHDWMWHQVLLGDIYKKEQYELIEAKRRHREMLERRKAYDEQIADENRKRQQMLQEERENENRSLEKMKKKMEQDYLEDIRRKKEQQQRNKNNFIRGHEMKLARVRNEKIKDRMLDDTMIKTALDGLKRDRERRRIQMKSLQMEKHICLENYNLERKMSEALKKETDEIADEWKHVEEQKADEYFRKTEEENLSAKKKAAAAYREYIIRKNKENEELKQNRCEKMFSVKQNALSELQKKLSDAEAEIERQNEYRRDLMKQINTNEKYMASEKREIEEKEKAFTKKSSMFRDAMEKRFGTSKSRHSTNPVHPFRRLMQSNHNKPVTLPLI